MWLLVLARESTSWSNLDLCKILSKFNNSVASCFLPSLGRDLCNCTRSAYLTRCFITFEAPFFFFFNSLGSRCSTCNVTEPIFAPIVPDALLAMTFGLIARVLVRVGTFIVRFVEELFVRLDTLLGDSVLVNVLNLFEAFVSDFLLLLA